MQSENKKLPVFKRVGGFLLIIIVLLGFFFLGGKLTGLFDSHGRVQGFSRTTGPFAGVALTAAFCALAAAVAVYAVTFLTSCFTFDFDRPFFAGFKKKLYFINIIVALGLSLAAGFFVSVPVTPILVRLGLPEPFPFITPILVSLIGVQLILVWINIWTPLNRAIVRKRLIALEIDPISLGEGIPAGVSNPERSSFRKLTLVEDDAGVLWIEPAQLVYRGDTESLELKRDNIISIECRADAGSMASYAGAVYPILRYRNTDGKERSVRFHAWGNWTLGGMSKSLKLLSLKLESWRNISSSGIGMKYYESHEDGYRRIKENNLSSWDELCEQSETFENFQMKKYLIASLDRIRPVSNARVLDIGCGTGPVSCFLAQQGYRVDGFDISRTAVEIARTKAKDLGLDINYSVDDLCRTTKTGSDIYDIIIDTHCMHCITYDSDRLAALANVFRLLKKDGYFVVETMSIENPSLWSLKGRIDEQGIVWHEVKEEYPYEKVKIEDKYWICTRRIMNPSDLENELKQTGFLLEHTEIVEDEKTNMADFQAICRKPVVD